MFFPRTKGKGGNSPLAAQISEQYVIRVAAAGGTMEAATYMNDKLISLSAQNLLSSASWALIPAGYKSGVMYSQIPNSANGDLTFTRASGASRRNINGLEQVASGMPRIDHMLGGAPVLLLEPQRRNNLLNAVWDGAGASIAPTGWGVTETEGSFVPVTSLFGNADGATALEFTVSGGREVISQVVYTLPNVVYAVSVVVESVNGNFYPASTVNEATGISATMKTWLYNNAPISDTATNMQPGVYTMIYSNAVGGSVRFRFGCNNTRSGTIVLSRPMVEDNGTGGSANYSTSFIPTTTTALTRVNEATTKTNVFTSGFISAQGGTLFLEIRNNILMIRDATYPGLFLTENANGSGDGFYININTDGVQKQLSIHKRLAGTSYVLNTPTDSSFRVAIRWNGATADIFVNGAKSVSATPFTALQLQHFGVVFVGATLCIGSAALWKTPLSDAQCITLSTL